MKNGKKMRSKLSKAVVATIVAITMIVPVSAFASVAGIQADKTKPGKSLAGVYPAKKVGLQISLSEDAKHNAKISVNGISDEELEAAIKENKIEYTLKRDSSRTYLNPEKYPNQFAGGKLSDWVTQKPGGKDRMITVEKAEIENEDLVLTLNTKCMFYKKGKVDYSIPHTEGGSYMDHCGYFVLEAKVGDKVLGKLKTKVVPYDSYKTVYELYDDMEALAKTKTDVHLEKRSMGQTTVDGYDLPYFVISDSKESVDKWLKYKDEVEKNPSGVLKKIESGEYKDLRVPVVASNCHPNEHSANNGIMKFAKMLVKEKSISYNELESYTEAGKELLKKEMKANNTAVPELIKDYTKQIGYVRGNSDGLSAPLDLKKYYNVANKDIDVKDLLKDVIVIVVPAQNMEGYENSMREPSTGIDVNRDEANQVNSEDANLQHMLNQWNPMVFTEVHGRVEGTLVEPCTPPHEPNFEYDLIAKQFVELGEALGNGAIANNKKYNSFEMPARDYLKDDSSSPSGKSWTEPWDDMTTAYGSQYPVLIGTCGITYELPAYNDVTTDKMVPYGLLNQSVYVKNHKTELLTSQAKLFERGVKNSNSNKEVGKFYVDQYDRSATGQAELMRPVFDGKNQNKNFYPECYIIPMDRNNQKNLLEAAEDVKYFTRNGVKVNVADKAFTYASVKYPAGTVVIPMYQAKRSLANSQLSDGTFVSVWSGLYSESYAQRSRARGYDRIIVAEPKAYNSIKASCGKVLNYESALSYLKGKSSQFTGVKNADVIIENVSEDSSEAVLELLRAKKKVAMITEGKDQGDFICSYKDFQKVASKYLLTATGVYGKNIKAKLIKKAPKIYICGKPGPNKTGFVNTNELYWSNNNYNFNRYAVKAMGFETAAAASEADLILNSTQERLPSDVTNAVKSGIPYLGHGEEGCQHYAGALQGLTVEYCEKGVDMLGFVKYPNVTLTNSTYVKEKDDVMYEYGTRWFSNVPEKAKVIVQNAGKKPLQGCIGLYEESLKADFDKYNKGIQAIEYNEDGMKLVLFANQLTYKAHQQDEFTFISNVAFSKNLSERAYKGKGKAKPGDGAKLKNTKIKLNAKAEKASVKLTWKKSGKEYLTGYQIYRYNSKAKKYVKVKTVNGKSKTWTQKKLRKAAYKYKIRGYKKIGKKTYYTKWSNVKTVKVKRV